MNAMKTKAIFDHLSHLEALIQERDIGQARDLAETILDGMMQAVYRLVRGRASAKVMRTLLELEIEIGGDDGDFNSFNERQLIDLFERGQIFKQLEQQIDGEPVLSLAVVCAYPVPAASSASTMKRCRYFGMVAILGSDCRRIFRCAARQFG